MQGRLLGFLQLYAPLGNARITVPNQYKAWRRGRMKAVVGVRFLAMSWVDATWTLCAILRVQLQGFFLFNVQHIGFRQVRCDRIHLLWLTSYPVHPSYAAEVPSPNAQKDSTIY